MRTRLRVSARDAEVLEAAGAHLGSLAGRDLAAARAGWGAALAGLAGPATVAPDAESERTSKQDKHAEPEQPAAGGAPPRGHPLRFARVAIRRKRRL